MAENFLKPFVHIDIITIRIQKTKEHIKWRHSMAMSTHRIFDLQSKSEHRAKVSKNS